MQQQRLESWFYQITLNWAVLEVSWLEMKCWPKHTWIRLWTATPTPQENLPRASTSQEDFKIYINYFSHLIGPNLEVHSTLGQFFSGVKMRMPLMITNTGRLILLQGKRSKTPGLILNFLQALSCLQLILVLSNTYLDKTKKTIGLF